MVGAGSPTLSSEVYQGRGDRITVRVIALSRQRHLKICHLKFYKNLIFIRGNGIILVNTFTDNLAYYIDCH